MHDPPHTQMSLRYRAPHACRALRHCTRRMEARLEAMRTSGGNGDGALHRLGVAEPADDGRPAHACQGRSVARRSPTLHMQAAPRVATGVASMQRPRERRNAHHWPEKAPMMAALALHRLQHRQYATGTTALPIRTPMSRYTYLHRADLGFSTDPQRTGGRASRCPRVSV